MLPLLESLDELGGAAKPGVLYDLIASKLDLTPESRAGLSERTDRKAFNLYERRVRWTRQTAVFNGLIDGSQRSIWQLTQKAKARLKNIVAGKVLHVFHTSMGSFLWGNAEDVVGYVERDSVSLIMSSPPYPLNRPRPYGNESEAAWGEWMIRLCESWLPLLTKTGSIMLNLGPVWKQGVPAQSLYIERFLVRAEDTLGLSLLQRLDWHSTTKLPVPLKWVGIDRCRVTPSVEPIFWLSPSPHAFGDNRQVLRPYTKGGLRAIAGRDHLETRPSGFKFGERSFVDQGGSIPPSLIIAPASAGEEMRYRKAVRAVGKVPHPAMMPAAVARFGIQLATKVGDTVADFLCGAATVPIEAIKLGRHAIGSDRSLEYLESAALRCQAEGLDVTRDSSLAA
jgi:site-specific DNA-methyltransferase (cytosine-N4-specific)